MKQSLKQFMGRCFQANRRHFSPKATSTTQHKMRGQRGKPKKLSLVPPKFRRSLVRAKRYVRQGVSHNITVPQHIDNTTPHVIHNVFGNHSTRQPVLSVADDSSRNAARCLPDSPFDSDIENKNVLSDDALMLEIAKQETFQRFALSNRMQRSLMKLSYTIPTWIQEHAIPVLLSGESALLVAECGSGKTAAYLIPLLSKLQNSSTHYSASYPNAPRLLILAPTQELVIQTEQSVQRLSDTRSLAVCLGHSSLLREYESLARGCDAVVGTPQRVLTHIQQGNLLFKRLEALVIDEADVMCVAPCDQQIVELLTLMRHRHHRILNQPRRNISASRAQINQLLSAVRLDDKGLTRKPESGKKPVRKENSTTAAFSKQPAASSLESENFAPLPHSPLCQLVLVTAVKTTGVSRFIQKYLQDVSASFSTIISPKAHTIQSNIHQVFVPLKETSRMGRLREVLQEAVKPQPGVPDYQNRVLIFVNSIRSCKYVTRDLKGAGYSVDALHGDLPPLQRKCFLENFRSGRLQILVVTNLACRGLDIPSVGHVIMFSLSKRLVDYIHRVGRACRSGAPGKSQNSTH